MKFHQAGMQTLLVRVFLLGVAFFSGVINARYLGPEYLGAFTLLLLIPSTCFRFGNLGLGSGLSFFASKQEMSPRRAVVISVVASFVLSSIAVLILLVFLKFGYSPWGKMDFSLTLLMLIVTPFFFIHSFLQRTVSGFLLITKHNISEIIVAFVKIVILLILVVFLNYGILGSIIAYFVAEIVVVIYLLICLFGENINSNVKKETSIVSMWKYCKWNYLILLNRFLFEQAPLFLLSYFVPFAQVGAYAVGKNLATRAMIIPDTFSNILFPYNSSVDVRIAKQRTDAVVRNFLVVMGLVVVFLFFLSKPFISHIYGDQYQSSILLFRLILPTLIFFPVYKFQIVHLSSIGMSREASKVSFFSLPIVCVLSLLLIPNYGVVGACITLSATNFLLTFISMHYYLKYTDSRLRDILMFTDYDFALYREFYIRIKRKKIP